eukprot:TRINITY_DN2073_c0_g1_i1.p1 TRINITY_DN2073_c0_g1~~TRINITY_DN2073_c0_g1_i1.p1  ORF type:complete len:282 (+),score=116.88 TRINITY_DN2073_c0_g1_i1:383-1228(+)
MEPKFDFVVFDWKGTLEKKGGNKKLRQQKAMDAVKKDLSVLGHDPIHFESVYLSKTKELKHQEAEHLVNVSIRERMDMIFDLCNITSSITRNRIFNIWVKIYMDVDSPEAKLKEKESSSMLAGWKDILRILQNNGIPICLLRNSSLTGEEFQKKIDSKGAGEFFHYERNVVLSGEVGFVKPHPNAFKATLEKCGLEGLHSSNPKRILFVGNETEADVIGSNGMGWSSVLIRTTESSSNGEADYEIDDLMQLKEIVFGSYDLSDSDSDDYSGSDSDDFSDDE